MKYPTPITYITHNLSGLTLTKSKMTEDKRNIKYKIMNRDKLIVFTITLVDLFKSFLKSSFTS